MKSKGTKRPRSRGCEPTTAHLSCRSTPYATVYLPDVRLALINEWHPDLSVPSDQALMLGKGKEGKKKTGNGRGEENQREN